MSQRHYGYLITTISFLSPELETTSFPYPSGSLLVRISAFVMAVDLEKELNRSSTQRLTTVNSFQEN